MTAALQLTSDQHRVGAGFSVRFAIDGNSFDCEWSPRKPTKREFGRIADRYRAARNSFIAECAKRLGGAVLCVEV